jgi:hypothetical protein
MFRRVVLALAFVAALGAGGLGLANSADAHGGGCGRGGYYGYYGAYYPGYYPAYYGPRAAYYGGGYGGPYGGYNPHHHHHSDVFFSIGF